MSGVKKGTIEGTLPVKKSTKENGEVEQKFAVGKKYRSSKIRVLQNLKRIQFKLIKGVTGRFYWTVHLPTQLGKSLSKDEIKKNLGTTIDRLMTGRFDILDIDLTTDLEHEMFGGYKHLRQLVNTRYANRHRRKLHKKKLKKERKVKKNEQRKNKGNVYRNLSKACLGRRKPRKRTRK